MSEQKYFIFLSFVSPPNFLSSYPRQFVLLFQLLPENPISFFYCLLFSLSFFVSGQYRRWICVCRFHSHGTQMPLLWTTLLPLSVHRANCSLQWQPSSEAYCLGCVCTQCSSHLLCWLAPFVPLAYIFGLFLCLNPWTFIFPVSPKWPFSFHCQTAVFFPFEFRLFLMGMWLLHSLDFLLLLHCWSESINMFIYFLISDCQCGCLVLMLTEQAVGRRAQFNSYSCAGFLLLPQLYFVLINTFRHWDELVCIHGSISIERFYIWPQTEFQQKDEADGVGAIVPS